MTIDHLREAGITLIELLVVLTLLAVVAGIAVPIAYTGLGGVQVQSASRRLVATMRLAHDSAVSSRTAHRIAFDPQGPSYRLMKEDGDGRRLFDPSAEDDAEEDADESGPSVVVNEVLPEGVAFLDLKGGETDTLPTFWFDPQGHSSGGEIVLGDSRVALRVILERAASGVRVETGDRDDWD